MCRITDIMVGLVFGGPSNGLNTNLKTGVKNVSRTVCKNKNKDN